jgi:hypothetical protein
MSESEGDSRRTQALRTLSRLSDKYPALRIGQLIVNALPPNFANDPYYIEDSDLIRALLEFEQKIDTLRGEEGQAE